MTKIQTTILVSLLLLVCGAFVSGATLSVTDLALASSDASGTIDVMLDQAPTGLAGYQLEISATPQGSAEFTAVNFPAAFSMNSASTLPASSVSIVAVDLMDQIKAGASAIKLATLTVHGLANGAADLQIAVTELTDDSGNPISPTIQPGKLTIGAAAPTPTPTQTPVAPLPTEVPTSVPTPTQTPPTPSPTEAPSAEPTTTPTMEPVPQPTGEPEPLVAAFTALPMTGTPPLTVNFTDHSTGGPKKWRWDFGDGTMSTAQNPTHVYGGIGRYTVTLEAIRGNYSSIERKPEFIRVVGDYPTGPSGYVMVTSQPSGAGVYMGDLYLGTTPATLIVPAGSRSLSFLKDGYQKKTVHVTIRPDEIKLIPKVMLKSLS